MKSFFFIHKHRL